MEMNKVYQGDTKILIKEIPDNFIDLTVTSPPYDNLRDYKGYSFDFETIARDLYRITKEGGILVWIVADETMNFCESLTSFKQAIYFVEICNFNLLDTMIYKKRSYAPAYPTLRRYANVFEYMFILSKGKPKIFNPLREDKCKSSIAGNVVSSFRQKDGSLERRKTDRSKETKERTNVWEYLTGSHAHEDKIKFKHPATFPNELAKDHILSWSKEGDLIFDPFAGSGTTLKMAKLMNRNYLGFEIAKEYIPLINERKGQEILQHFSNTLLTQPSAEGSLISVKRESDDSPNSPHDSSTIKEEANFS